MQRWRGGEEVEDEGGEGLRLDVESEGGGWNGGVFGGGAERIEDFAEGQLEGAGSLREVGGGEVVGVGGEATFLEVADGCRGGEVGS